jgi:hypothetical protein
MENNPYIFLSFILVFFFGVMCIIALGLGMIIFVFGVSLSNFFNIVNAEILAPPAEDFLASTRLHPWGPGAFGQLSAHWKGDWSNIIRMGRYEGYARSIVKSLQDLSGPGLIAFTIDSDHRQERKSIIILKTSAQRVELNVSGSRLSLNMQAQAWIDGIEWGSITVTYPTCLYRSIDRATEARWAPILREKRWFIFAKLFVSDPDYYPLVVNNRIVAALSTMWIRNPRANTPNPLPPALQSVNGDLNADEQGILLIMLGMSLYFDSMRRGLGGRYDW